MNADFLIIILISSDSNQWETNWGTWILRGDEVEKVYIREPTQLVIYQNKDLLILLFSYAQQIPQFFYLVI